MVFVLRAIGNGIKFVLDLLARPVMSGFAAIERGYGRLLPWSIRNPLTVLGVAAASVVVAVLLGQRLGMELIPEFAQGQIKLEVKLPPGHTFGAHR